MLGQLSYPELVPAGGPTRCSQIQAWFGLVKLGKETSTVATLGDLPGPEYREASKSPDSVKSITGREILCKNEFFAIYFMCLMAYF